MKKITSILLTGVFALSSLALSAQEAEKEEAKDNKRETEKTAVIEIQTSAVCDMCKERIERELTYTKGVRFVELDSETKIVKVEYRTSKTDPDKIRKVISDTGYDADDMKADQEAHDRLPACCQKGNEPH